MNINEAFEITKGLGDSGTKGGSMLATAYLKRDFMGLPIEIRVKYIYHKGYGATMTTPEEDAYIEIHSITTKDFSPTWTKAPQYIEVYADLDYLDEMAEVILEILDETAEGILEIWDEMAEEIQDA